MLQAALLVISALTCTCLGRPQEAVAYADEPPVYTYTYAVADDYSGSNFGADEQRDGPVASGSYFVNLPDSRVQKVSHCVCFGPWHADLSNSAAFAKSQILQVCQLLGRSPCKWFPCLGKQSTRNILLRTELALPLGTQLFSRLTFVKNTLPKLLSTHLTQ